MASIDSITDEHFMHVAEVMALAADATSDHQPETLLVISLAEEGNNAIMGGDVSPDAITKLENLLAELRERAVGSTLDALSIESA